MSGMSSMLYIPLYRDASSPNEPDFNDVVLNVVATPAP